MERTMVCKFGYAKYNVYAGETFYPQGKCFQCLSLVREYKWTKLGVQQTFNCKHFKDEKKIHTLPDV